MLTSELKALDAAFSDLVKRRRGSMIRRGGAGSRDFEISFPFRGHEVLVGVEVNWLKDDALFVFIRHGRMAVTQEPAHPFIPPRPEGLPEVVGGDPLRFEAHGKTKPRAGGRAGTATAATASAPAGSREAAPADPLPPAIPGFSIRVERAGFSGVLRRMLVGPAVYHDRKRPGWFHAEVEPAENYDKQLPAELAVPLSELGGSPGLGRLSIAMTQHIFRVRRVPLLMDAAEIDEFVTRTLELFGSAVEMPPAIPTSAEPGLMLEALIAATGARCGVCGDPASERRVACARCLTPHHEECWKYGGGCSVYGCGSSTTTA